MNPSGFVTGQIARLMHGLDGFLERDRAREMCDRAQGRAGVRAAGGSHCRKPRCGWPRPQ